MNHLGPILGEIMKWLGERRFDRTALPMHCPALPSTVNRDPFKWIPVKLFFPTSTLDELRVAKLSFAPISFGFLLQLADGKSLFCGKRLEMKWSEKKTKESECESSLCCIGFSSFSSATRMGTSLRWTDGRTKIWERFLLGRSIIVSSSKDGFDSSSSSSIRPIHLFMTRTPASTATTTTTTFDSATVVRDFWALTHASLAAA